MCRDTCNLSLSFRCKCFLFPLNESRSVTHIHTHSGSLGIKCVDVPALESSWDVLHKGEDLNWFAFGGRVKALRKQVLDSPLVLLKTHTPLPLSVTSDLSDQAVMSKTSVPNPSEPTIDNITDDTIPQCTATTSKCKNAHPRWQMRNIISIKSLNFIYFKCTNSFSN